MPAQTEHLSIQTATSPKKEDITDSNEIAERDSFEVETSWQEQPLRLPAYTPSSTDHGASRDSPPTTPVDDPIHVVGGKKHFGFSSRQSRAASIFPWQKHKPAVCHQYAPHRPPVSKRSSLAGLKILPMSDPDPVKHMVDQEIDILKLKGDQLKERVLELLHLMEVQDWAQVLDYHELTLDRISGAMTNCIYLVSGPPPQPQSSDSESTTAEPKARKVLLRVYGVGLESLFSREKELQWLRNLSTMDIGPSLLGIFKNGRFEQYVESTTLTKEDIRDAKTSRHIAHRMCELHNIVNVFPPPEGTIPQSQENIAKWIPLAKEAIGKICQKYPSKRQELEEFNFEKLLVEIDEVHRELINVHSPLVFAHNDTQYGNILRTLDESGELVVIDFEYAGYNTRAFDIGNHFCEWTADYHSERPSLMHPSRYPTKEQQLNFLEAYMEAEIAMCGYHLTAINLSKYSKKRRSITSTIAKSLGNVALSAVNAAQALRKPHPPPVTDFQKEEIAVAETIAKGEQVKPSGTTAGERVQTTVRKHEAGDGGGGVTKAEILDSMYKEVNKFALTSHIMWGLWGLIQATQSEIEFDYVEYALQRLSEFRARREEFMSL